MQRKFITNLAIILVLNLLIKPFWVLGVDRAVQNSVGAAEYGLYFSLFNFSLLFNILLDCGITNFNNKNISQNNHLLDKHLSSIIVLRGFLAIGYMIISFIVGLCIGYNALQLTMLALLGVNQIMLSFIMYLRSNLAGLHLFKTDSIISVLDRLLMIIVCGVLLWGPFRATIFKIEWFIYAQTISYVLTSLIALVVVLRKTKLIKLNTSKAFFIMILKKSYPYAVLGLLMTFYNRIDSVMLERLLPDGDHQSGVYASAYRLLDASNMIAYLFSVLLLPMFSKMIKHKESVEELARLAFSLLVVPAIALTITSYLYRYDIMALLYHDNVDESSAVFGILMFCFIPVASNYIFGTLLTANGSMRQLNIVATTGMLINISLNFALISTFKSLGTAYSSSITQFVTAIAQIIIVQQRFKFHVNYRFICLLLLYVLSIIFIGVSTKFLFVNGLLGAVVTISVSAMLAFVYRIISIKGLISIVKNE